MEDTDIEPTEAKPKRGLLRKIVKFILFIAALVTIITFLSSLAEGATNVTVNVSSKALSSYVFAETGERLWNKPVLQSEITAEFPLGFYATIWHSTGFDSHFNEDGGDELDYYVGWSGELVHLELEAGAAYFDAVDLFHASGDTVYLYAQVGKTFGAFTPFVKGNFYLQPPGSDLEGGTVLAAGLSYEVQSPLERLSIPVTGWVGHDDGTFGLDSGFISRVEAEATWQLNDTWSILFPTVSVNVPLTVDDSRKTYWVFGGGFNLSF